jgi:K+/H+ antiporter YhaU regulatory subunit KhtT
MEAMVLSRPGIVPCIDGVLSLVTEKNADKHAYFNFAGRFTHTTQERQENEENIRKLLTDKDYFEEMCTFSSKYAINNYDVSKVSDFMSDLYCKEIEVHKNASSVGDRLRLFCNCTVKYIGRSFKKVLNIRKQALIWYRNK